jgi:hypothetical protein
VIAACQAELLGRLLGYRCHQRAVLQHQPQLLLLLLPDTLLQPLLPAAPRQTPLNSAMHSQHHPAAASAAAAAAAAVAAVVGSRQLPLYYQRHQP